MRWAATARVIAALTTAGVLAMVAGPLAADSENFVPPSPDPTSPDKPNTTGRPIPLRERIPAGTPHDWDWYFHEPNARHETAVGAANNVPLAPAAGDHCALPADLAITMPERVLLIKSVAMNGLPSAVKRAVGPFTMVFPPAIPTELFCDAQSVCVWMQLHPEVVPDAAAKAHLAAIGEPAGVAVNIGGSNEIRNWAAREIGPAPDFPPDPPLPFAPDERTRMLVRMATAELASGYPYAMDPNYCRRTLMLGGDAAPVLIACTRSGHKLLRRNATAMLGALPIDLVRTRLRELAADNDLVVAVRALRALGAERNPSNADLFLKFIEGNEPVLRSVALDALSRLRDPRHLVKLSPLLSKAIRLNEREWLWDLLPCIARIGGENAEIVRLLGRWLPQIRQQFPPGGMLPNPANPQGPPIEPANHHKKILAQMAEFALASLGDETAKQQVMALALDAVFAQNLYLFADVLARIGGDAAVAGLKALFAGTSEPPFKVKILWAMAEVRPDLAWFGEVVARETHAGVRAQAFSALAHGNIHMAQTLARQWAAKLWPLAQAFDARDFVPFYDTYLPLFELANTAGAFKDDNVRLQFDNLRQRFKRDCAAIYSHEVFRLLPVIHAVIAVGGGLHAHSMAQLGDFARWAAMGSVHALRFNGAIPGEIADMGGVPSFELAIVPGVVESAVRQLGQTADVRALPILIDILDRGREFSAPEAALVLAHYPYRPAVAALLNALASENAWIRLCAYLSLKHISGEDFFADWLFGSPRSRQAASEKYAAWAQTRFG